jgi:pimeloyl-ACP methyl ester carboxylesterase
LSEILKCSTCKKEAKLSAKNLKKDLPTIVTIPCFSGAPWDLEKLEPLSDLPLRTMRLPEGVDNIEDYANFVHDQVLDLKCYVVVGDSFGAVIAIAFAIRQPPSLMALAISGGFASNPVQNPFLRARIKAARFLPGPLYRHITLRMHAASLASPYDRLGEVKWSRAKSRELFLRNTPHKSFVARSKAALQADYKSFLQRINVPTLIITPSYDSLIGEEATRDLIRGIPDCQETVLGLTGHMLRYSHPNKYAGKIRAFLEAKFGNDLSAACK